MKEKELWSVESLYTRECGIARKRRIERRYDSPPLRGYNFSASCIRPFPPIVFFRLSFARREARLFIVGSREAPSTRRTSDMTGGPFVTRWISHSPTFSTRASGPNDGGGKKGRRFRESCHSPVLQRSPPCTCELESHATKTIRYHVTKNPK